MLLSRKCRAFHVVCAMAMLAAGCGGGSGDGSVTIGSSGGTAVSDDGRLTIDVPAGALQDDTEISIKAMSTGDAPEKLREVAAGDTAYLLEPAGLVFSQPALMTLVSGGDAFLDNDPETGIALVFLATQSGEAGDPESLTNQGMRVNLAEQTVTVTGELSHFSWIVRAQGLLSAKLEQIEPREWQLGQAFEISSGIHVARSTSGHAPTDVGIAGAFLGFGSVSPVAEVAFSESLDAGSVATSSVSFTPSFWCSETGIGTYTLDLRGPVHVFDIVTDDSEMFRMIIDAVVDCKGDVPTEPPDDTTSQPFTLSVPNPGDHELGDTFEVRAEIVPNVGPGGTSEDPRAVTGGAFRADADEPVVGPPEVMSDPRFQFNDPTGVAAAEFTCIEVGTATVSYSADTFYTPFGGDSSEPRVQGRITSTSPEFECVAPPTRVAATVVETTGTLVCSNSDSPFIADISPESLTISSDGDRWSFGWTTRGYSEQGSRWSERNGADVGSYREQVEMEISPEGQPSEYGVRFLDERGASFDGTRVDIFSLPDRAEVNVTGTSVDGGPFQFEADEFHGFSAFDPEPRLGGPGLITKGYFFRDGDRLQALTVGERIFTFADAGLHECQGRIEVGDVPTEFQDDFGKLGSAEGLSSRLSWEIDFRVD